MHLNIFATFECHKCKYTSGMWFWASFLIHRAEINIHRHLKIIVTQSSGIFDRFYECILIWMWIRIDLMPYSINILQSFIDMEQNAMADHSYGIHWRPYSMWRTYWRRKSRVCIDLTSIFALTPLRTFKYIMQSNLNRNEYDIDILGTVWIPLKRLLTWKLEKCTARMWWYSQTEAYQPAIGGTSKINPCSLPSKNMHQKAFQNHTGRDRNQNLRWVASNWAIWAIENLEFSRRLRSRESQGKADAKKAAEAQRARSGHNFFSKEQKKQPERRQEGRQTPHIQQTKQRNQTGTRKAKQTPEKAHPNDQKFKTNATKTRETTPPPPRPTRNRRASEASSSARERQNRRNTPERRGRGEDNAEANKSRHKPGGRTSDQTEPAGQQTQQQRRKKKKQKRHTEEGGEGNDENNQTTREGKRRGNQRTHRRPTNRSKHNAASKRAKKRNDGRTSRHHPPQRATSERIRREIPGKKRRDSKAEHARRGGEPTTTRKQGQRDDQGTRHGRTRAKSTTHRRAEQGAARSKTKTAGGTAGAKRPQYLYFKRKMAPNAHPISKTRHTPPHTKFIISYSMTFDYDKHDCACTNLTMMTWMCENNCKNKVDDLLLRMRFEIFLTHNKMYDDAMNTTRDKWDCILSLYSTVCCGEPLHWSNHDDLRVTKDLSFLFWTEQKCRETYAMCDDTWWKTDVFVSHLHYQEHTTIMSSLLTDYGLSQDIFNDLDAYSWSLSCRLSVLLQNDKRREKRKLLCTIWSIFHCAIRLEFFFMHSYTLCDDLWYIILSLFSWNLANITPIDLKIHVKHYSNDSYVWYL